MLPAPCTSTKSLPVRTDASISAARAESGTGSDPLSRDREWYGTASGCRRRDRRFARRIDVQHQQGIHRSARWQNHHTDRGYGYNGAAGIPSPCFIRPASARCFNGGVHFRRVVTVIIDQHRAARFAVDFGQRKLAKKIKAASCSPKLSSARRIARSSIPLPSPRRRPPPRSARYGVPGH